MAPLVRTGDSRHTGLAALPHHNIHSANEAWLDFVSDNRAGSYNGESFDIIFGPVANDDVYTTFNLYTAGVLSKEQTLEALKIKKLYNQMVFTSEKALSYLKFIGTVPEEEF